MTIVSQSRTEPNQFTVHELVCILFKQIEYKRNYVGLALCISFIMCTFWLSVRFRMCEWLFVILGVFVCVLSAWMSRIGNGGVSKCYAPITAFRAQSPDHIPSILTVCLSVPISL